MFLLPSESAFDAWVHLLLTITVFLIVSLVYRLYLDRLSHFPGPKSWAFSRLPYLREMQNGTLVHRIKQLHEKYGETVRIAPNEVSFISASAWQDLYGHNPGRGTTPKSPLHYAAGPTGVHSLFTANDSEHSRYRRLLAQGFSDKSLREWEPILQAHTSHLINSLRHRIISSSTPGSAVVNLVDWFSFTGYDIISEIAFGKSFDCIGSETHHLYTSMLYESFEALSWFASFRYLNFPGLERFLQFILPKSLMTQRRMDHFNLSREMVRNRIDQPVKDSRTKHDLVSYMLRKGDDTDNKGMTVLEVEATINDLLLAGSESSSTALAGISNLLLRHPKELKLLQNEVRKAFATESEITVAAVRDLPYLGAVIEEGLRLAPPVPLGLLRQVAPEGQYVSGHWIPGGTQVSATQYGANRSALHFDAPSSFIPSRWLPPNPAASPAFNPFSLGPRNCIGKNLSYVEMRLVLAKMMLNFDLAWEGKEFGWESQKTFALWPLWNKKALMVRIKERTTD